MKRFLPLFGPLAGVIFFVSVYVLALGVDGYSHVAQTISEIGKTGTGVERPFQVAMIAVDICLIVFAIGIFNYARSNNAPIVPAGFILYFGIADIGVAAFPSPHPLHNVFGLSLTIGYLAPLALAITWRDLAAASTVVRTSWIAFVLVVIAIFLNLSPLFARDLYPLEYYGVVQRSLFVVFYGWCAYLGVKTWR